MNVQLLKKLGLPEVTMEAGAVLLQEGQRENKVFVLLDGEVIIKSKGRKIAEVDGAGAILGEISALLSTPHEATVTAARQSRCYVIQDYMKFIFENPEACVSVAQVLAVRLVNMNNHFVQVKEQIESLQRELENYLPIFPETSP